MSHSEIDSLSSRYFRVFRYFSDTDFCLILLWSQNMFGMISMLSNLLKRLWRQICSIWVNASWALGGKSVPLNRIKRQRSRVGWSGCLIPSSKSLLNVCLLLLSIIDRGLLRSPFVIMDCSSFFSCVSFWFVYFFFFFF